MQTFIIASLVYWLSILLALLNYGSVDLLTVALLALPIFSLLLILLVNHGIPDYTRSTFWMSTLLFLLIVSWVGVQTSTTLGATFGDPAWSEIWDFVPDTPPVISVSPADDRAATLRIAVPFGVFLVGLLLFSTDDRAKQALRVLSVSGGTISALSIAQFYISPDLLLFDAKAAYLSSLTGLFVNRNTAATFLGLVLLLNASSVEVELRKIDFRRHLGVIAVGGILSPAMRRKVWSVSFDIALLASSLTALMLTKSRGGIGATFIAVCSLLIIKLMRRPRRGPKQPLLAPRRSILLKTIYGTGSFLILLIVFVWLGQRVMLRSHIQDTFADNRFCVTPGILLAVRDHFPFGAGLSSFSSIFPGYRDPSCGMIGVWDRAHNAYLEGLLALGLVFILAAVILIVWLTVVFFIGIRNRRSARFAGELGLASLILILIHSAFDFSIQISGLAIFLAAMLAPIATLCLRPARNHHTLRRKHLHQRRLKLDESQELTRPT